MRFNTRDERFLEVHTLRIGTVDIDLGQGGLQLVFIEREVEDEVEYDKETHTLILNDTHDRLRALHLVFEDGEYWLREKRR